MLIGYNTPGKGKARTLLSAFCKGAGGKLASDATKIEPGPAAFYGVVPATKPVWDQCRREGRDWYYVDNAFVDSMRETYFRITKNRLQHSGRGESDCKRFDAAGIPIKPWRSTGSHILVCPQSDPFMRDVVEYPGNWLVDTVAELKTLTDRPIRIRPWTGNKREWYASLPADLVDCWALVTYSSASSITAILAGVPAIVTGEDCIAHHMAGRLSEIESPPMPDGRREWAGVIADNQYTISEMESGYAWERVNK